MDLESKKLLEEIKTAFEGHNDTIIETIKVTVNGKIDKLTNNFDNWKKDESEKREAIEKKLDLYIETTKPVVEFFNNMSAARKVGMWGLGGVATIGATYLMVKEIFIK